MFKAHAPREGCIFFPRSGAKAGSFRTDCTWNGAVGGCRWPYVIGVCFLAVIKRVSGSDRRTIYVILSGTGRYNLQSNMVDCWRPGKSCWKGISSYKIINLRLKYLFFKGMGQFTTSLFYSLNFENSCSQASRRFSLVFVQYSNLVSPITG